MSSYADEDIGLTARAYLDQAKRHRPLSPPLVRATTFEAASAEQHRRLWVDGDAAFYQRFGHPTGAFVAERIARLERGEAALLFSAGWRRWSSSPSTWTSIPARRLPLRSCDSRLGSSRPRSSSRT